MKPKEIAILGPTASGKSALAIEIARKFDANILSLDSLAIYKETDIVSAKPTLQEREGIVHFGIDVLKISDYFSAATFFDLYRHAREESLHAGKHLIIVGGTGFYLKALLEGLSPKITPSTNTVHATAEMLKNLEAAYAFIAKQDPEYATKIALQDRYRIKKWFEIYYETSLPATHFFARETRRPMIEDIPIFEIAIDRKIVRERIALRTKKMLESGLIEEVFNLEKRYGRAPAPMKAIGIKETLQYLDGRISYECLHTAITTHTAQLAKRQETFNSSQFPKKIKLLKNDLIKNISKLFN